MPQELLAGRRQGRAALVPDEELPAKQALEGVHPGADRRLSHIEPLGGAHEAAVGDDLQECAGKLDVHAATAGKLRSKVNGFRLSEFQPMACSPSAPPGARNIGNGQAEARL